MTDIVLVHGAWHGSWCWRRVLPLLWLAGHRVVPVTLTGLGERAHQISSGITLGTHVEDVVAAMRAEECSDAVLVGHSYGGLVVTGAADRLFVAAARVLRPGGQLWCVYNNGLPHRAALRRLVGPTRVAASDRRFTVTVSTRR